MFRSAIVIVLLAFASSARAQECAVDKLPPAAIMSGAFAGQNVLEMDAVTRGFYAMGVMHGLYAAPYFRGEMACVRDLSARCVSKRSPKQVSAIVLQFLQNNPSRWHEAGNVLVIDAIVAGCDK